MRQRRLASNVGASVFALAGACTPAVVQGSVPVGSALAGAARPILVLESYVGSRPDNAGMILEPLFDELTTRGFAARPAAIVQRIGDQAPRPGALDKGKSAAEIMQPAETAFAAYTRGRFAEAEAALTLALDQVHRNPALLVLDTSNLHTTFKILVGLALSREKRGDTIGSAATMVELIRTFPTQPIGRADYGPDAEQLYRAVWNQVQGMGRGQLSIIVENDQAVIFVDGQIRGIGKAVLADLVPGVYRVFVQVPSTAGRQYEIGVSADHHAVLHVDWDLDSSLWVSDSWIGFVFMTDAERARQAELAGKLARRWGGGNHLAVVSMVRLHGTPGVSGTLYDIAGHIVRSAVVTLDGPDDRKLRSLAKFLAEGIADDGVSVVYDTAPRAASPPATARTCPTRSGRPSAPALALAYAGSFLCWESEP